MLCDDVGDEESKIDRMVSEGEEERERERGRGRERGRREEGEE